MSFAPLLPGLDLDFDQLDHFDLSPCLAGLQDTIQFTLYPRIPSSVYARPGCLSPDKPKPLPASIARHPLHPTHRRRLIAYRGELSITIALIALLLL